MAESFKEVAEAEVYQLYLDETLNYGNVYSLTLNFSSKYEYRTVLFQSISVTCTGLKYTL